MSLTSILDDHPEVKRRLAALVASSAVPPRISSPLRVPPRSDRYRMIGRAFDYLLRFEIQRRYPGAVTKEWVAEASVERMRSYASAFALSRTRKKPSRARIVAIADVNVEELPRHAERAEKIVKAAKLAIGRFVKDPKPETKVREDAAGYAVRLARVEVFYRAGRIDPEMDRADVEDVGELLALLGIVPFDILDPYFRRGRLLLNPTFGMYSHVVGGADADIVAGGALLDVKTTKYPDFKKDLAQIIGYGILADRHRAEDPSFPEVREIGFYFSRHGVVQTIPYGELRSHPDFRGAVEALFRAAEEDVGPREGSQPS